MKINQDQAIHAEPIVKPWRSGINKSSIILLVLTVGFVFAIPACEQRGIEEQEVAKGIEEVPEQAESAPAEQADADSEEQPDTRALGPWAVPEGWTLDPEPRQMRLATYLAPDQGGQVEVAVSRFPGRVGGELANINRWRGQMGLPPVDASGLETVIERFSAPGFEGYETRIESPNGVMLAAGVYDNNADQSWFVRATLADAAVADRIQGDLFSMARSIAGIEEKDDG